MGKIIPKTDKESQAFWASVERVAREVATWPAWKRGIKKAQRETQPDYSLIDETQLEDPMKKPLNKSTKKTPQKAASADLFRGTGGKTIKPPAPSPGTKRLG